MKGLIAGLGIFGFLINIIIFIGMAYVAGSTVVSVVKITTNQCNIQLGVEPHLNGNWFCPKKAGK